MSITMALILASAIFSIATVLAAYACCVAGSRADDEMEAEGASEGAFPQSRFEESN